MCGHKKTDDGRVCCNSCREKQREYKKKSRDFFKSIGLCPKCGENRLFGDEKMCPECLAKAYEYNRKSKEHRNISNADIYKKDIARLKSEGLCRGCRKRKVEGNHTYCQICLIKHRERGRKYRAEKSKDGITRSERPSYGLCYTCGNPIDVEGKRSCSNCQKIYKENLNKASERQDRSTHVWRRMNNLIKTNGGFKYE